MSETITDSERMELLLNYLTKLGRGLLANEATVVRVQLAIEKNAEAYHLKGTSCLVMNSYVSVCFHDRKGHTYMKQLSFQGDDINLEKLRLLNDVSYNVCRKQPDERKLAHMLQETEKENDLPDLSFSWQTAYRRNYQ